MTTGTSTNLKLALPVQGELSGTWGNVVNYGITDYTDIAVAGTLTLTGDGAVTLTQTTGSSSSNGIVNTTAQYAVILVTGTLTTTKVITCPAVSKTYTVINAATGGSVQVRVGSGSGVTVGVGDKAVIAYNGTDFVQVASSLADGVTTITFGSTGLTPNTATSGAVTVAGTLANTNGGTGQSSPFTQYGVTYASTATALATTAAGTTTTVLHGNAAGAPTFGAVALAADVSGTLPNTNGGTGQSSPFTQYGVTYASTATALATTAAGTAGYVLTSNASSAPTFQVLPASGVSQAKVTAIAMVFGF
jgi:hypothetical protein